MAIASSSNGAASIARVSCATSSASSAAGSGGPRAARGAALAVSGVVPRGSLGPSLIRLGLGPASSAASAGRFGALGSRLVSARGSATADLDGGLGGGVGCFFAAAASSRCCSFFSGGLLSCLG